MPATALEQMLLELLNRARLDPAAEAARYGIALNEGVSSANTISTTSKQPLAMNESLLTIARAHSQDMIDRDYFAHNTPEGQTPGQRMAAAGYSFTGENIAWNGTTGSVTNQMTLDLHQLLFVDANVSGRGHRTNMMLANFQEVGMGDVIGVFTAPNGQGGTTNFNATMLTQDFGVKGSTQFLTGVSYADNDHDNFYSLGEGRNAMAVAISGGLSTSTGAAGGYSVEIGTGPRTVTYSGGGLTAPITVSVTVTAQTNAKVDVVDQGVIRTSASLTDLGGATTIIGLGTIGLTLTGDSGMDTIVGTSGNDTLKGAGGNDTIDGGAGSDTAVFTGNRSTYTLTDLGAGRVRVAGPDGSDTLSNVEFLKFDDQTIPWVPTPIKGAVNDFNGDKRGDILFQHDSGALGIWLMNGTSIQQTSPGIQHPGAGWQAKDAADFNGDGKADILWQHSNGTAAVWLVDGISLLGTGPALANPGPTWHANKAADFNGDGKADILWQNDNGAAAVWLMDGVNVQNYGAALPNPGPTWHEKAAADFDGDGKADILWQNDNGAAAVWLMNGANLKVMGGALPNPGPTWHAVDAGDFNGDTKADILWQNDNGATAVWLMDGTNLLSMGGALPNPGPTWHVKEAIDANGDGKADILFQNDNGAPAVWLMNGTNLLQMGAPLVNPGTAWHII